MAAHIPDGAQDAEDLSSLLLRVVLSQQDSQDTAAQYLAASLSAELRGRDIVIEGQVRVTVTVRERVTGQFLGGAEHALLLPVAQEHRPPADTDVLEVEPGTADDADQADIG